MKKLKTIPKFKNENEEDRFWSTHSFTDYFDINKAVVNPALPNLKNSLLDSTSKFSFSSLDILFRIQYYIKKLFIFKWRRN